MRLSTSQEVDLTQAQLFDRIADFDRIEAGLAARGAEVTRLDPGRDGAMGWDLRFLWRGRMREMRVQVVRFDRARLVELLGAVESIEIRLRAEVTALTAGRARLDMGAELGAHSMKGRLIVQTARLMRARLDEKFSRHVERYVRRGMI